MGTRVETLTVFYEVTEGEDSMVRILAVRRRGQNVLIIAGKEIRL